MVRHQACLQEAVDMHEGVVAPASNVFGGGYRPMVQLFGGSSEDPLANRFLKKFKLADGKP